MRLLLAFRDQPDRWLTTAEVARRGKVSSRTAPVHSSRLVELVVLDVERVFAASRRRRRRPQGKRRAYLERWGPTRAVFGQ